MVAMATEGVSEARMLLPWPAILRGPGMGSLLDERIGDPQCLRFGHVAFDSDDGPVVVDEERVGGQAQGLAPDVSVRVGEEELVGLARDPVALVTVNRDLLDGGSVSEHLAEELGVGFAVDLSDEDRNAGLARGLEAWTGLVDERHLALRRRGRREQNGDLIWRAPGSRHLNVPRTFSLRI